MTRFLQQLHQLYQIIRPGSLSDEFRQHHFVIEHLPISLDRPAQDDHLLPALSL